MPCLGFSLILVQLGRLRDERPMDLHPGLWVVLEESRGTTLSPARRGRADKPTGGLVGEAPAEGPDPVLLPALNLLRPVANEVLELLLNLKFRETEIARLLS